MDKDAYITVADNNFYALQAPTNGHQKQLRLFPAPEPLELTVIEILGSSPKTKLSESAHNFLDRPVHEADRGRISLYSDIDERGDRIRW